MIVRSMFVALGFLLAAVAPAAAAYVIGYDETKAIFAGRTMLGYDPGHGSQVEYVAPNGRTYLLYPGSRIVLPGSWKLTKTDKPKVFNICFRYPANSYDPVSHQSGGGWECQIAGFYLGAMVQILPGDVFGLARAKTAPFILSPQKTTLTRLLAQHR